MIFEFSLVWFGLYFKNIPAIFCLAPYNKSIGQLTYGRNNKMVGSTKRQRKKKFSEWIKIETKLDVCFKVLIRFSEAFRQYLTNDVLVTALKPTRLK